MIDIWLWFKTHVPIYNLLPEAVLDLRYLHVRCGSLASGNLIYCSLVVSCARFQHGITIAGLEGTGQAGHISDNRARTGLSNSLEAELLALERHWEDLDQETAQDAAPAQPAAHDMVAALILAIPTVLPVQICSRQSVECLDDEKHFWRFSVTVYLAAFLQKCWGSVCGTHTYGIITSSGRYTRLHDHCDR